MKFKHIILYPAMLAAVGLTSPVHADISARYEQERESAAFKMEMTVEIDGDGNTRLQTGQQPMYMLVIDGVTYVITRTPTGAMVVRMDDFVLVAAEFMAAMDIDNEFARSAPTPEASPDKLVPMGERVVNGRTGTAYGIAQESDEAGHELFVLSSDPELAPLQKLFMWSMETSRQSLVKMVPGLGSANLFAPFSNILSKGAPLKLMGMKLTDVSFAEIEDERFVLPATPLTIDQLREQYRAFPAPPTLPARD